MKLYFGIAVMAVLATPVLAESENTMGAIGRIGIDVGGSHEANIKSTNAKNNTDPSLSFGIEVYQASGVTDIGIGAEKQLLRGIDGARGTFGFIPVYLTLRYFPGPKTKADNIHKDGFYFSGKLGYGFVSSNKEYEYGLDSDGGLCFGAGAGMFFGKSFFMEAIYSRYGATFHFLNKTDVDISYSKIGVYIGGRI